MDSKINKLKEEFYTEVIRFIMNLDTVGIDKDEICFDLPNNSADQNKIIIEKDYDAFIDEDSDAYQLCCKYELVNKPIKYIKLTRKNSLLEDDVKDLSNRASLINVLLCGNSTYSEHKLQEHCFQTNLYFVSDDKDYIFWPTFSSLNYFIKVLESNGIWNDVIQVRYDNYLNAVREN